MSEITHEATVVDIDKNIITLELIKTDACHNCAIKNVCQQKRNILAKVDNPQNYTNGQTVSVFIEEKKALTAIFLGYILPLMLVLAALFGVLYFLGDETLAAFVSLGILPVYYLGIYCFDKKLKKTLSVRVEQP